jgi:TatD DNase family protein
MRLIDSHCHLDFSVFSEDRELLLQQAHTNHVSDIVIPAVVSETWGELEQLCVEESSVKLHAAYGLHPMFMSSHQPSDLLALERQLSQSDPVAVGECGLDFFVEPYDQQQQLEYFIGQMDLAVQFQLPMIIHSRKSLDLVLKEIRLRPGLRGVIHSFSGSYQQAKQLIDLGFYLGFGGPITYARAKKLRKLVMELPLESLLLETDAPDQPDVSHHGLRNQPAWLMDIAKVIAELRCVALEQVAEITTKNCCELFGIKNAPQ